MKIIDRYIGKTITQTTLLVLLMLIAVTIFVTFIQEISDLGTGNYGFLAVLMHVFFSLPSQVYSFFPMAMLLGTALGLGLLANHNELTILRASGISLGRITTSVMKAAVLLLIIATALGEWLSPMAEHYADSQKTLLTNKGQALATIHGTWIRDGSDFIYITTAINTNHLEGISRYHFNKQHDLSKISYARSGTYTNNVWQMQDITESKIAPTGVTSENLATAIWHFSFSPKLLRISAVDPTEMTLWQLNDYIKYLQHNHLSTNSYLLAFWQRVLQPLATLVMIWLAIPFVFGSQRSITMGIRMVVGISLGFGFYLLNQFFGPFSIVFQWPPLLAALIPTLLFALMAYLLQRRVS